MNFLEKNKKSALTITLLLVFFVVPLIVSPTVFAQSQVDYTLLQPLPDTGSGATLTSTKGTDLSSYLNYVFKLVVGFAGVLAVLFIVWGGVEYMSTDAIFQKNEGKERITHALYGLLIVAVSWIILNTINPKLVSLDILKTGLSAPNAIWNPFASSPAAPVYTDTAEPPEVQQMRDAYGMDTLFSRTPDFNLSAREKQTLQSQWRTECAQLGGSLVPASAPGGGLIQWSCIKGSSM